MTAEQSGKKTSRPKDLPLEINQTWRGKVGRLLRVGAAQGLHQRNRVVGEILNDVQVFDQDVDRHRVARVSPSPDT